ncbi:MAG: choice-of-anchor D domain-containing protein [Candidatus Binatales bacterium]
MLRTSVRRIAMAIAVAAMVLIPRLALCAAKSAIVAPESLSFPNQVMGVFGSTSAPKHLKISIRKSSTGPVTIQGISVGGVDSGDFAVKQPDDCIGASLKPGASCTIELTFTPTAMGKRSATLTVSDSSGDSRTVALSGHALKGILRLKPRDLSFGRVRVGAGKSTTVTLRNDNPVPLIISAISIAGGGFTASQNCVGELPGGGGACPILVGVSPAAARRNGTPVRGMLEIGDDAAGSPHKVKLSAIVVAADDPAPVPTATPTSTSTPAPADPLAAQILVTNSACDTVTSYAIGAAGNAAPIVAQSGLCNPTGVAVDSSGNIYVTNIGNASAPSYSVTVYPAGTSGNTTPSAIIGGSSTGLVNPSAIALDGNGNIYVANNGSDVDGIDAVTVYPAGSNGNVAPSAIISGSSTGLDGPAGVAVDSSGKIYVANWDSSTVTIYPAGSTGNVAPSATIRGYATGLNDPSGITVDGSGKIYVSNQGSLNGGSDSVTIYAAGSNGNAAPSATIAGPSANVGGSITGLILPTGIAVDSSGNVYVANRVGFYPGTESNGTLTVYPAGSSGNVAPSATIANLRAATDIALDRSGNIYVVSDGSESGAKDTVAVYSAGSNSNAPPIATIALPIATLEGMNTGISVPGGVVVDGTGNLYVSNVGHECDDAVCDSSVIVYPAGSTGNSAPSATISGPKTQLEFSRGIALDGAGNIYVANVGSVVINGGLGTVTVYPAGSNGNVAPSATIGGSFTGLNGAFGIAVDASGNIYVANAYSNTVTVYPAGSNGNVAPSATIGGSNTGLSEPYGIAVDAKGNIYATNYGRGTVTVYPAGSNGNATPSATISGSNTGLSPVAIALDGSGNIYVTDSGPTVGPAVTVYPAGSKGNVAPSFTIVGSDTGLYGPSAIALDGNGNIYVGNTGSLGNGTVTVYPRLALTAVIGSFNTALVAPAGVALDSSGNIYVTCDAASIDSSEDTVTVYPAGSNGSGTPIATISGGLSTPVGITLDGSGNIYVANQGKDTVTVYSPLSAGGLQVATIQGDTSGLNAPTGIALDGGGNIYVTNEATDTVTVYPAESSGNAVPIATIAGSNTGLGYPSGVAIDGAGNIYVANKATDTVTIYAPGSNGNVAPSATIGGSNTGMDAPAGIALDASGNIYVTNEGGFDGDNASVTVFPPASNGNIAPEVTIAGLATQLARPQGIAVVP